MKSAETLGWIKVAGVAVLGFVGVKAALAISDKVKAGAKIADAAAAAAREIVTKDLNPASTENVVYKGVNTLTGGDNTERPLGARIWEYFHPDKVAAEKGARSAAAPSEDERTMMQTQEAFRRLEIQEENTDAAVEEQMDRSRSNFRLTEIIAENNPEVYVPAFYPNFVRK